MLNRDLNLNQDFFSKDVELLSARDGFGDGLITAATSNSRIVGLCADLTESTRMNKFEKEFPERFIQVGIAEQNMASIAAGLSFNNLIPFIASFSTFNPGRNWEQIRDSVCYSSANVKIVGTHYGLTASSDGPTAQALEDISLTRVLPHMVVINPIDYYQAYDATVTAAQHKGPVYLRIAREATPVITSKLSPFEIGKAYVLKEGLDLSVFTTGVITAEVLHAIHELESKHKINCEVVAVPTIKPLDVTTIIKSIKKTKKAVSVEEHQIFGGLGSAIAEMISQNNPVKLKIIGINDTFCESGTYKELKEKYGLNSEKLKEEILNFVRLKR